METSKLILESATPQEESGPPTKIRVEFVREYENPNGISSFEILPNNNDQEIEFNTQWMAMWDALARKDISQAYSYVQYPNRENEFFYLSHTDKEFLTPPDWIKRKVDWAVLAKQFQVPLKLINRCDNHIALIHIFPLELGKNDPTYLEVNFSKNVFKPWKVEQYQLYWRTLPRAFKSALEDKTKRKDFDWCVQKEEDGTKGGPSLSDRSHRRQGFRL